MKCRVVFWTHFILSAHLAHLEFWPRQETFIDHENH
jgi:hypothetical protein